MNWYVFIILPIAFVQNMAFTWSSRSRNSGDPFYHFRVAILSNGVWFFCNTFLMKTLWDAFKANDLTIILLLGILYIVATSLGSSYMMYLALKMEKGKRRVGASHDS